MPDPGLVALPGSYSEIFEVRALCSRLGNRLGSVSPEDCLSLPLRSTGSYSVRGAPILAADFPPAGGREPIGRVLLIGGIHGDEFSAVSIVFKWLEMLQDGRTGPFYWRVAPTLNPDGLLRRPAQRMNARGIDLNRNFPSPDWRREAHAYWRQRTGSSPRRFPGPAPLSEPESRWLANEIRTFQPSVVISVHAPLHVVDYDGPPEPPKRLGNLGLRLLGTYPGSLGRWAGIHLGLSVVTIELESAGTLPATAEQERLWADMQGWLKRQLSGAESPPHIEAPSRVTASP